MNSPAAVIASGRSLARVLAASVLLAAASVGAADEPPVADSAAGVHDVKSVATTVCAACHGADGNSVIPMFPKLAGQHPVYLAKQLNDYFAGRRKNDIMAGALVTVQRADVAGLAAYFAAQVPATAASGPDDAALASRGRQLYESGRAEAGIPACGACHDAPGAAGERYPRLAGQSPVYLLQTLGEFKSGARMNDKGRVMRNIANHLDDSDLQALAAFLASR